MGRRKKIKLDKEVIEEIERVSALFEKLDENKKSLIAPLIEKAAFMSIELNRLQLEIKEAGWTQEYQNGKNQFGKKKSAEADTYISLSKNYSQIIKQLTDLVPPADRKKSKLALLREE